MSGLASQPWHISFWKTFKVFGQQIASVDSVSNFNVIVLWSYVIIVHFLFLLRSLYVAK